VGAPANLSLRESEKYAMQITVNNDFQHGGQVFSQAQINSFL